MSNSDYYHFRVDMGAPTFFVQNTANTNSVSIGPDFWYLYSNKELSNNLPTLIIGTADNPDGAPLNRHATMLSRDGDENTGDYTPALVGQHGATYTYDYQQGDEARQFTDDTVTELDVLFQDDAGNRIDTHNSDGGIWVVMDITPPDIEISEIDEDEGGSNLTNPPGTQLPVGVGTTVQVHVNVTDIGAHKDADGENMSNPWMTPAELLKVEARLFDTNDTAFMTDWIEIPFNTTRDGDEDVGYFWSNLTLPMEWRSGVTRAEIRVTDPIGNVNQTVIPGNVSVDADLPIIEPRAPVVAGGSSGWASEEEVEFRVRAWHPGDTDPWGDEDTDRLGIEKVHLHYRIGDSGRFVPVELDAQDTADTYAASLDSFDDDDVVYFYYSAEAISGTVTTYPGPNDPHELTNVSANNGRVLVLEIDRDPPEIKPAFDLAYVGGPGDHRFSFNVTDEGIGVDDESVVLHWRRGGAGTFQEVALARDTIEDPFTDESFTAFTGTVPRQSDGDVVEYYVEADDLLGNQGSLGSIVAPLQATVDLTPPTVTVSAPGVSEENRFNVTWEGEDDRSGVRDFSLQFRIGQGTWITVPDRENTRLTSYEVCAATDVTYEFRVSARDNVGNIREFPEVADASTQVTADESCLQPPELFLDAPSDGATLSGDAEIRWRAISTVFPEDLSVRIEVGGQLVVEDLSREGSFTWNTARYDPEQRDPLCFADGDWPLVMTVVDPANMETSREIMVTLDNGRASCEPQPRTTGIDPADFEPVYLLVVLAFVGLAAVFAVGMARRW